jgi:thiaminase/transcriptional activator TenA
MMTQQEEHDPALSPSFIVPDFAHRCFKAAAHVWAESFRSPFVTELLNGSLDTERFRFYQMQDARYLEAYADACSVISTRIVDPSGKLWFIDAARMAILVEQSLHENYGLTLGYSAADIASISLSPDNRAYQNHIRMAANHGSLLEGIAALSPCPWLYADIGQFILSTQGDVDDGHPYADWIRQYSDPIFVSYTNELLEHLEYHARRTTDEAEKNRAVELFVLSTRYELLFWDQAWNGQSWPDESDNGSNKTVSNKTVVVRA